jgi:hypothetical protein
MISSLTNPPSQDHTSFHGHRIPSGTAIVRRDPERILDWELQLVGHGVTDTEGDIKMAVLDKVLP